MRFSLPALACFSVFIATNVGAHDPPPTCVNTCNCNCNCGWWPGPGIPTPPPPTLPTDAPPSEQPRTTDYPATTAPTQPPTDEAPSLVPGTVQPPGEPNAVGALIIGGTVQVELRRQVMMYSFSDNTIGEKFKIVEPKVGGFVVSSYKNNVLVSGGFSLRGPSSTSELYINGKRSTQKIEMITEHVAGQAFTTIGKTLYTCGGGKDEQHVSNLCQYFSYDTRSWSQLNTRMPEAVAGAVGAHDDTGRYIYIMGGAQAVPGQKPKHVDFNQRFDFKTGVWTKMRPLPIGFAPSGPGALWYPKGDRSQPAILMCGIDLFKAKFFGCQSYDIVMDEYNPVAMPSFLEAEYFGLLPVLVTCGRDKVPHIFITHKVDLLNDKARFHLKFDGTKFVSDSSVIIKNMIINGQMIGVCYEGDSA